MTVAPAQRIEYRTAVSRPVPMEPSAPDEYAQVQERAAEYRSKLQELAADGWAPTRDAVSRDFNNRMQWTTTRLLRPTRPQERRRPHVTIQQARAMVDRYTAASRNHPPAGDSLTEAQETELDSLCYWRAVLAHLTGSAP